MKKVIALSSILFLCLSFLPNYKVAAKEGYFVVTAYYSPLPNQKYYMTGDLESEKRLQGHGIAGASGRKVFSGMLAAPSKYAFGTKVYIEGLGIGDIQDRGGAIVPAGKRWYAYDRLDVWMGYGDEWLKRALAWGKRTVPGYIVKSSTPVTIDYTNHIAPEWALNGLKVKKTVQKKKTVFDVSIWVDSSVTSIKKLQTFFKNIGIYKWPIDGIYNQELIDLVLQFQLANNLISSKNDIGAGYWGPKTRTTFEKRYNKSTFTAQDYFASIEKRLWSKGEKLKNWDVLKKQDTGPSLENNREKVDIFDYYTGTTKEHEEILKILTELWFYNGPWSLTDEEFFEVIYTFQRENAIVVDVSEKWAGYFGPKTRSVLEKKYSLYVDEKEKIQQVTEITTQKIKKIGNVQEGTTSDSVRELQKTLAQLWYFESKDTAYFWPVTKESVIAFQLDNALIDSKESQYAGIVGDRTLETIGTEYHKYLVNK